MTEFLCEISETLATLDLQMPGTAEEFIRRIGAIGGEGRNRNQNDYDQLEQILAELHIMRKVVARNWPEGTTVEHEPNARRGGKNLEILVSTPELGFGIEVKTPNVRNFRNSMTVGTQATSRAMSAENFDMLPRDNPVKDAVASADEKFRELRAGGYAFVGILVIVWDTMTHEVISALLHPSSGLFTKNTFDPEKRAFADVDVVVIVPHQQQLIEGPGNRRFTDATWMFDWPRFPFSVFILNPKSESNPASFIPVIQDLLNAEDQRGLMGAEYAITDMVFWIDSRGSQGSTELGE